MKDFKAILEAASSIDFTRQQAALATVVRVTGSSYRSPGARMLITNDGRWVGSISGGCLEGDALRKARQVMRDGVPMTVTYDTREESNQQLAISLGCNGVIDVLIEPIIPDAAENPLLAIANFVNITQPLVLVTCFSGKYIGQKMLLSTTGRIEQSIADPVLSEQLVPDLLQIFSTRHSETREYEINGQSHQLFLELIQPGITLIIFGGGVDARPVSNLAKMLGWNVEVTDECAAHIAPVFFPNADKLSLCQRQFIDRDFTISAYTACLLMSHNYQYDRDVLRKLLPTQTPYIGIMGPRKRVDKMALEFVAEGKPMTDTEQLKIHAPVGLDIGAESADEIAVSIIGEIQSFFSARAGGFLKDRKGPIHHRKKDDDQVYKQAYLSSQN